MLIHIILLLPGNFQHSECIYHVKAFVLTNTFLREFVSIKNILNGA